MIHQTQPPPLPVTAPLTEARAAGSAQPERLGTVLADRVCTRCYFNLAGQPVVRETHYGLVVVRCPECGTIASVQEYPHLSRWSRRVVVLVAIAWFGFLSLMLLASAAIVQSSASSLATHAAEPSAVALAKAHLEFQKERASIVGPQQQNVNAWYLSQPASPWSYIEQVYLDSTPPGQFFAQSGAWSAIWTPRLITNWSINMIVAFAIGVCWSVALPHARRWRRLIIIPVILGLAVAMGLVQGVNGSGLWNGGFSQWMWTNNGWQFATHVMLPYVSMPVTLGAIATASVTLVAGVYLGRGIARWGARILLPPRLREPLFFLWLCDGYQPPKVR